MTAGDSMCERAHVCTRLCVCTDVCLCVFETERERFSWAPSQPHGALTWESQRKRRVPLVATARPTPHGITHTCVRDTLTPGFPISKLLNLMDILLLKIFRHGLKCVASSPKPFRGP